jgi:hypothetical protein
MKGNGTEVQTMAQPLFVGTLEELLERKDEFVGMRLQVYASPDEDFNQELPLPPLTIRDKAHLEELLLAGLASPKEPVTDQEWSDLRREIRERLAARKRDE